MPIAKRVGLAILSPLFVVLLFATAFDVGFTRIATHPATVKRLVSESGIYDSVTTNVLAQTKTISTPLGDIPTSDPAIQKAARVALSPRYIQQNTEMAIDNVYLWLDGKIAQPNFTIDLSGAKTLFANNIADSVQKRLTGLPACNLNQSLAIIRNASFDAYNATCLPRGISPAIVAEGVKAGIIGQQDFLKNIDLSSGSIKNSNGQSVFSGQLASAPKQYQRAKKTPAILIILTILTGAAIIFLSSTWQRGIRHIGLNLIVVGLIMLIFAWSLNRAVGTSIVPKIKVDNAIFQQDVRALVKDLTQQIDKNYWWFGGIYTGVGVAALAGIEVYKRRSKPIQKV